MQSNQLAPDGYRYGVMFQDGSVADYWNGSTQRQRAAEYLDMLRTEMNLGHEAVLVRKALDQQWERA